VPRTEHRVGLVQADQVRARAVRGGHDEAEDPTLGDLDEYRSGQDREQLAQDRDWQSGSGLRQR
jgi:hypothetical protein